MIRNQNIICISSIDWDFIWQGHQEIMSVYAQNGNRVIFIENTGSRMPGIMDISRIRDRIKNWLRGVSGIREIKDNLYVFSPLVLPFPYLRIAAWVNHRLLWFILQKWFRVMNFNNPVVWVFLPTPLSLAIIDNLSTKLLIYYCIDNFRANPPSAKKIMKSEIRLLKMADLVFVTSRELYNYSRIFNSRVHFFPFAVNFQEFEEARLNNNPMPDELKSIKSPIVGYIGGVHKWINLKLVKEAALKFPEYSFVFVGPLQADISLLSGIKNIHFLGKKPHKEIPYFIKNFDVCTIPYIVADYTKNVYPTKLNEYHAMGKPVVSTDLPEIACFNHENDNLAYVGKTQEEFLGCISRAIAASGDTTLMRQRISSAKNNCWVRRIEEMDTLSQEAMDRKALMPFDWKENLLRLYRATRIKFLMAAFVFLSLYLSVFYTPLMWYLAQPLKISEPPRKADCIVVFAGGVGESRRAGQGYEERVQYAVELYRQGYAKHIIFSSGYMYVFKEPLVMKALAVSLGVPEEAIILENKASGTHENVKFTNEILINNGWNEILLISSPYHMRRVSLVFNKVNKRIKVTYTPIRKSLFYSHPERDERGARIWKRVSLQQISCIVHEYLGIVYYWKKGYA